MNVDSRLRATRVIWVATASPRGRPDAVPGWFWWDGDVVYFIKGRAERVTERSELERVDQAYRAKYVDPHSGASATIFIADDHVYRVIPRLVMAWSYADMTTRTDWRA